MRERSRYRVQSINFAPMNLSAIRLVVTDIDGTLLDSRHKLSNDFYPTFSQLKSKGILFSAASGRQQFNLQKRFEPIVEDVIFISENGSYVSIQE